MGLLRNLRKRLGNKRLAPVETVPTVEKNVKKKAFPEIKPVGSTKDLLKEWSKTIEMVENHPLSQARVINTTVLNDLTQVLNSMNEKLEKLAKLDEITSLLLETKQQLESAGLSTGNIDAVMGAVRGLTIKDKDALSLFKGDELFSTEDFAERASLSRSTASSRLNKLFSLGMLEKSAEGKKILYKVK
ncbi:MAG: hypothetical protein WC307_00185 [Candidatus Nanoarchaeia archaeon]|jgi:DNA-binding transcriptional ArsR family regulator